MAHDLNSRTTKWLLETRLTAQRVVLDSKLREYIEWIDLFQTNLLLQELVQSAENKKMSRADFTKLLELVTERASLTLDLWHVAHGMRIRWAQDTPIIEKRISEIWAANEVARRDDLTCDDQDVPRTVSLNVFLGADPATGQLNCDRYKVCMVCGDRFRLQDEVLIQRHEVTHFSLGVFMKDPDTGKWMLTERAAKYASVGKDMPKEIYMQLVFDWDRRAKTSAEPTPIDDSDPLDGLDELLDELDDEDDSGGETA
jgi:hypothetical protein